MAQRHLIHLGTYLPGALLMAILVASPAYAQQNLTWDANGATAGTGGSGTWNTTSPLWFNGTTYQAWNNATLDNAIFGGSAGNITLAVPITVHDMTFNVGGYLFPSVETVALSFGGVNPTITTNVGFTQLFTPLTGSTGFTKDGAGTLQLGGTSAGYTGITTVNAGTLAVSNSLALGFSTAASNLVLNNGSTINFSSPAFNHNYTLTGGIVNLQITGISTVVSSSPTLTASTILNFNGTGTSGSFSGSLADTGANILSVTKNDTGRMTLSGNNSYTGSTTVTRGRLQLNSVGALSAGSNLIFNGALGTGGSIELTSNSGNFTRSLGTGAGQVQWLGDGGFLSSGSARTVNLGAGSQLTWGNGGFVPTGNRLILGTSSNNTLDFQNRIDLSGGLRAVQGDGGTLGGGHARLSGVLSGSGGLNQVGNGLLQLTGINSYSGGTTMTSGTLIVSQDANLGAVSGVLVFDGGTLENIAAFTTGRGITINAPGGTFQTDANLIASGIIDGAGRLTKTGVASLILSGANSYSGGTTINAGTLQIGNGGTTGSIVGAVVNNSLILFNRSDAAIFGGVISGSGGLRQGGTGSTILTGANSYTGGTTISAGTLQIGNGGTTGSIVGNVLNNGIFAFDRFDAATFNGLISGTGSVAQRGAGALTLGGANSYSGGTVLAAGTVVVGADINLGDLSGGLTFSGGTLENTAAFATTRSITLDAPGGTFQTDADLTASGVIGGAGQLTKTGTAAFILTGANSYSGGTIINAGRLQIGNGGTTGSLVGTIANNSLLAFDRSDDAVFGGVISGAGDIEQRGAGTLALTGNSAAFAGTTSVLAGTLMVNGTLGSTLDVLSGGRLAGNGTVGTINVAAGGTVAPGAPFGTLTASDVGFAAVSIYEVKTDPAGAITLLHVTGNATIGGGTVNVVTSNSVFRTGARYTILTADGARTWQFDAVTETLPLLDMTLGYDATHVYLDVARNSTTLCTRAVTSNQCAVSTLDFKLGANHPVVEAVRNLPTVAAIQNALDQLSGEVHASAKGTLLENSRYMRETVTDRLRQSFAPTNARSANGQAAGNQLASAELANAPQRVVQGLDPRGGALWQRSFGAIGQCDGNAEFGQIDNSAYGFLVGADSSVGDSARLGIAAGYGRSSFDVDARASSGASDDYHLALYGGTQWGALGLRLGAAHA